MYKLYNAAMYSIGQNSQLSAGYCHFGWLASRVSVSVYLSAHRTRGASRAINISAQRGAQLRA